MSNKIPTSISPDDVEEHVIRVARMHRRASLVTATLTAKMPSILDGTEGDVVRAVAQAITQNIEVKKWVSENESDFIARVLVCGMVLGGLPDDDERMVALRDEVNRLPNGYAAFLDALNEIIEGGGEDLVSRMSKNPAVTAEYVALERELGEEMQ